MCKQISVAAYVRMSSDAQDTSINDQRAEIIAYCRQHGYNIVAWFTDEGISGWKAKERRGFQDLIAEASSGKFRGVICWDQSRFSRFDPLEFNHYVFLLKREGVFIETVKEGRLDFDSLGGWLTASVQQHGKAEYCRSLAADTVRGRRRSFLQGKWMSRRPYGYRIESGKLAPGDAAEIAVVRRIFTARARGCGVRAIAQSLNSDRIPSPTGGTWHVRVLSAMLARKTYIGHTCSGFTTRGKFVRLIDEPKTIENTHPAIIDRDLWDRVQDVNGRKRALRSRCGRGLGHLSTILRCGCCGATMISDTSRKRYICGDYHTKGGCSCNTLPFDAALNAVANKIRSEVLMGSIEGLTAAVERVLAKRQVKAATIDRDALRKQLADLDRKLATAASRLLEVDPSLVKDLQAAMLALKEKRAAVLAQLDESKPRKAPQTARDIAAKLWELDELLRAGDPTTVREALSRIIDRVEIDYVVQPLGTQRRKAVLTGGTIYFAKNKTAQVFHKSLIVESPQ